MCIRDRINGAWTEGIAFNEFMDRFNEACAVPFANYYNSNTDVYKRQTIWKVMIMLLA